MPCSNSFGGSAEDRELSRLIVDGHSSISCQRLHDIALMPSTKRETGEPVDLKPMTSF